MGCGNKSSDKSQSNSRILLSGISYPAMSENNIVEFSKSDFTTGAIRSIEQIPLDMTIENRVSISKEIICLSWFLFGMCYRK